MAELVKQNKASLGTRDVPNLNMITLHPSRPPFLTAHPPIHAVFWRLHAPIQTPERSAVL